MIDFARQLPPQSDGVADSAIGTGRRIPIKDVLPIFREAGLPRDIRSLQRYCESGLLDGIKELTATGETWFIAGESIEPAITQLKQMHAAKGERQAATPPVVSSPVDGELPIDDGSGSDGQGGTMSDTDGARDSDLGDGQRSTGDDADTDRSGLVAQLETRLKEKDDEIGFLRGEIETKNSQLTDASERDRETNILIQGLQSMVLQLTGNDRPLTLPGHSESSSVERKSLAPEDPGGRTAAADSAASRETA